MPRAVPEYRARRLAVPTETVRSRSDAVRCVLSAAGRATSRFVVGRGHGSLVAARPACSGGTKVDLDVHVAGSMYRFAFGGRVCVYRVVTGSGE